MKYTANEWLERYYHYVLLNTSVGAKAKEYLQKRYINEEMIKEFKIGYSPSRVEPTLGFLKAKGFSFNELINQKVLIRYQSGKYKGKLSDPFKGRIVFPIKNFQGKTVAFGGRTLDKNNKVKYINSGENPHFIKGDNLYGFSQAKEHIRREGYVILLEGYFDVIRAHQNNIKNTVATLGTSLTRNQALLIKSVTPNVLIAFDGDDAGIESGFKSTSVLKEVGCTVRIGHIKNGLDADDFIRKYGPERFRREVVSQAKPFLNRFIEHEMTKYNLNLPEDRFAYASKVLNVISKIGADEKEKNLMLLGETLNIPLNVIYQRIKSGV